MSPIVLFRHGYGQHKTFLLNSHKTIFNILPKNVKFRTREITGKTLTTPKMFIELWQITWRIIGLEQYEAKQATQTVMLWDDTSIMALTVWYGTPDVRMTRPSARAIYNIIVTVKGKCQF